MWIHCGALAGLREIECYFLHESCERLVKVHLRPPSSLLTTTFCSSFPIHSRTIPRWMIQDTQPSDMRRPAAAKALENDDVDGSAHLVRAALGMSEGVVFTRIYEL